MASFKLCVCLILLILKFSMHESRPLVAVESHHSSDSESMRKILRELHKRSEELMKMRSKGDKTVLGNTLDDSKRISPGGPDPRHH
ncbi:unnamed protein product [Cochlearia groenlandica]